MVQEEIAVKERNRPRSLPEYLAECCGLDFHELLTEYGLRRPVRLREALGCAEGTPIRHVGTRLLRTLFMTLERLS